MGKRKLRADADETITPSSSLWFQTDLDLPAATSPGSREDLWHWPTWAVQRVQQAGMLSNLVNKFRSGVELTTDYSGVGTGEVALQFIQEAVCRLGIRARETPSGWPSVACVRAGDLTEHCRKLLMCHRDGPTKPACSSALLSYGR